MSQLRSRKRKQTPKRVLALSGWTRGRVGIGSGPVRRRPGGHNRAHVRRRSCGASLSMPAAAAAARTTSQRTLAVIPSPHGGCTNCAIEASPSQRHAGRRHGATRAMSIRIVTEPPKLLDRVRQAIRLRTTANGQSRRTSPGFGVSSSFMRSDISETWANRR